MKELGDCEQKIMERLQPRIRKSHSIKLPAWLFGIMMLLPVRAAAQELVSTERIEDWFYSRLVWAGVLAAICGALIGVFHLSRLRAQTSELHVNRQARRKFWIWTLVILVAGAILLLVDVWTLFPFSTASLTFTEAFTQVWLNYRTILVLIVAFISFYIFVALTTRFISSSRCPYAFVPGPRGK